MQIRNNYPLLEEQHENALKVPIHTVVCEYRLNIRQRPLMKLLLDGELVIKGLERLDAVNISVHLDAGSPCIKHEVINVHNSNPVTGREQQYPHRGYKARDFSMGVATAPDGNNVRDIRLFEDGLTEFCERIHDECHRRFGTPTRAALFL